MPLNIFHPTFPPQSITVFTSRFLHLSLSVITPLCCLSFSFLEMFDNGRCKKGVLSAPDDLRTSQWHHSTPVRTRKTDNLSLCGLWPYTAIRSFWIWSGPNSKQTTGSHVKYNLHWFPCTNEFYLTWCTVEATGTVWLTTINLKIF